MEKPALLDGPITPAPTRRPSRVLVVEDNVDSAHALALLLRLAGHRAEVAYNGADGLAAATAYPPDAVFCDVGMSGLDGCELARRLRTDPTTARAVLVGVIPYGDEAGRRKATAAGFDHVLAKPADPEEFLALLACRARRTHLARRPTVAGVELD